MMFVEFLRGPVGRKVFGEMGYTVLSGEGDDVVFAGLGECIFERFGVSGVVDGVPVGGDGFGRDVACNPCALGFGDPDDGKGACPRA